MTFNTPSLRWLFRFGLAIGLLGGLTAHALADVNVHFTALGLTNGIDGVTYKLQSKYIPLTLQYLSAPATRYTYSGNTTMTLYREGIVNGKPAMVPIGRVVFPDGATGTYMVMIAGQPSGAASGVAVSLLAKDFPLGSIRVFNLTPLDLNVNCDISTFDLRPGGIKLVHATSPQFGVNVSVMRNGEPDGIATGMYPSNPTFRTTIFLMMTNTAKWQANPKIEPDIQILPMNDHPST